MKNTENLLKRFLITYEKHQLIRSLTHNSFSEKNNSRYVFLGMYAFKGVVAEWVFNNVAGTGTQLQQYLGNMFKHSFLNAFFDKNIKQITRIDSEIDINTQKYIFAYALFGFVFDNANDDQLKEFVFHQIIIPNDSYLPNNYKYKNYWDQLIFLCKQQFDCKPKLTVIENKEKLQTVTIVLNNQIIAQHQSTSFKYAKKKTISMGLNYVSKIINEKVKQTPIYIENEKRKIENEIKIIENIKQEKQKKHIARNANHKIKMKLIREQNKIQAQQENHKRVIAKEKTSRKGANTIYREYTAEEITNMSISKRRNLQDKGIIPQGLNN